MRPAGSAGSRAGVRRTKFAVVANVAVCSASCTAAAASTKPAPATSASPKGNAVCCKICLTRANVRLGFACRVGDHAGYAWRRSRGAEKGGEAWNSGCDVVDARDRNRIKNERSTGNGRAIVIEPELRPGPARREILALERAAQTRGVLRIHRSHREGVGRVYVTLRGARVCTLDRDQTRIADGSLSDEARIGTGHVLNGNRIGVPRW